jgi:hypothetical protein
MTSNCASSFSTVDAGYDSLCSGQFVAPNGWHECSRMQMHSQSVVYFPMMFANKKMNERKRSANQEELK